MARERYRGQLLELGTPGGSGLALVLGLVAGGLLLRRLASGGSGEPMADVEQEPPVPSGGAGKLVKAPGRGGRDVLLQPGAAAALAQLQVEARAAGFASPLFLPVSGYRSRQRQEELWAGALARYKSEGEARRWVARPGSSSHETGRAVDLWLGYTPDSSNVKALQGTAAFKWLAANAERLGWYPYSAEPWHWEHGKPHQKDYTAEIAQLRREGMIP